MFLCSQVPAFRQLRPVHWFDRKEATDPVTGSLHAAAHAVKDLAILGIGQLTSDPVAGATKIVTTIPKGKSRTSLTFFGLSRLLTRPAFVQRP